MAPCQALITSMPPSLTYIRPAATPTDHVTDPPLQGLQAEEDIHSSPGTSDRDSG